MIFIFDTETNGLKDQNHMISIGVIVLDYDLKPLYKPTYKLFCRPDLSKNDWNWHAQKVHGISFEKSQQEGLDIEYELPKILNFISNCEILVAHNIAFDFGVLKSDCERFGFEMPRQMRTICTMDTSKQVWPNRSKSLKNTFNRLYPDKNFDSVFNHHNALDDTRACANIFYKFVKQGIIKL